MGDRVESGGLKEDVKEVLGSSRSLGSEGDSSVAGASGMEIGGVRKGDLRKRTVKRRWEGGKEWVTIKVGGSGGARKGDDSSDEGLSKAEEELLVELKDLESLGKRRVGPNEWWMQSLLRVRGLAEEVVGKVREMERKGIHRERELMMMRRRVKELERRQVGGVGGMVPMEGDGLPRRDEGAGGGKEEVESEDQEDGTGGKEEVVTESLDEGAGGVMVPGEVPESSGGEKEVLIEKVGGKSEGGTEPGNKGKVEVDAIKASKDRRRIRARRKVVIEGMERLMRSDWVVRAIWEAYGSDMELVEFMRVCKKEDFTIGSSKGGDYENWVMAMPTYVQRKMVTAGKLEIRDTEYLVRNFVEVVICTRCWAIGHVKAECESGLRCRRCSGAHLRACCPNTVGDECCPTCLSQGRLGSQVRHAAKGRRCPVYLEEWVREGGLVADCQL